MSGVLARSEVCDGRGSGCQELHSLTLGNESGRATLEALRASATLAETSGDISIRPCDGKAAGAPEEALLRRDSRKADALLLFSGLKAPFVELSTKGASTCKCKEVHSSIIEKPQK